MEPTDDERLSRLKTHWTLVFQAHQGRQDAAVARELVLRYYGAAYRYLLGAVRDAAAAEDLAQEFAVRFLRGDFQRADPARGRFRDFLKTALRHLVIDHWRRQGKAPHALPADSAWEVAAPPEAFAAADKEFLDKWREELLARAWEELLQHQEQTGHPYHTLLRWKAEDPQVRSAKLADRLGAQQGKPVSEAGVRQLLHRGRQRFAELLVDEVASSLPGRPAAELEQELIDLDLLSYCQTALDRRPRQ
jgi:RNA polymerase sigma-70 factor (ECF subfamily)